MYCKKCGGKIESYASHCPFCGEALATNSVEATYSAPNSNVAKSGKSIGEWIITYIISAIPFIGFIMVCVWAFGDGTKGDPTFRNWAKSQFILYVIGIVLLVIFIVIFLSIGPAMIDELLKDYPASI